MIPYGRQTIDADDIAAVVEALQSDWLTGGPRVEAFEAAFAARVGAKYAVAVCNGTAALHLAMLVARIGPGDRVVTSANTFLASANCAAFTGALPDFCDIDEVTYTMSADQLATNWQPDTKAVVAVDYAGQTADMPCNSQSRSRPPRHRDRRRLPCRGRQFSSRESAMANRRASVGRHDNLQLSPRQDNDDRRRGDAGDGQ